MTAAGPDRRRSPSAFLPPGLPDPVLTEQPRLPWDPLRLCIFATIALLGWLGGPVTLVIFAALGLAGYLRAWRAGLTRSRCFLRDIRLVLGYLAALFAVGLWGVWRIFA